MEDKLDSSVTMKGRVPVQLRRDLARHAALSLKFQFSLTFARHKSAVCRTLKTTATPVNQSGHGFSVAKPSLEARR